MSLLRALCVNFCITLLSGTLTTRVAFAQSNTQRPVVVVVAQWIPSEDGDTLVIPLADALSEKQKNMITGGFTTVSQLSIHMPSDRDGTRQAEIFNSRCSVKFDAWEETYEVVKIKDSVTQPHITRNFSDYSASCLTGDLIGAKTLEKLAPHGGNLFAQLSVKQTSTEEAEKIKEWLIQQQSGMMQSLFSHMLGDIALQQTQLIHIQVPPKQDQHRIVPAGGGSDKSKG